MRVKRRFAQSQSDVRSERNRSFAGQKPQETAWMLEISQASADDCTISVSPGCA
jgi:hypothetical protein